MIDLWMWVGIFVAGLAVGAGGTWTWTWARMTQKARSVAPEAIPAVQAVTPLPVCHLRILEHENGTKEHIHSACQYRSPRCRDESIPASVVLMKQTTHDVG
jgi:hypothetical protein